MYGRDFLFMFFLFKGVMQFNGDNCYQSYWMGETRRQCRYKLQKLTHFANFLSALKSTQNTLIKKKTQLF